MYIFNKIELGMIIGNEQIIVPFDLEHIAGHFGPRYRWHIVSDRGEVVDDAPPALRADCTAYHHHLYVFIDVWPVHRLAHE